jgi:hypothetical protein
MVKNNTKQESEIKKKVLEKLLESQKDIIERKKKEKAEKEEKQEKIEVKEKSKEENLEEEHEKPEFFEAPQKQTKPQRKVPTNLEETFQFQDSPQDENLEESLSGVETPKKKEDPKEFYNSFSYGAKQGEENQKYGSPIQAGTAQIKQRDIGPLNVADIRIRNTTTGISSDVQREINEYSPKGTEEKYNVRNMEQLDPNDLSRDRNKNPFLHDTERVEMKYE